MNIKYIFIKVFVFFARPFFCIIFDRKYIQGKWFTESRMGWIWLLKALWFQKILGFNRGAPVPISHASTVSNWDNIKFHPDDIDNFQSGGCYYQNYSGMIVISKGVYIAPNVGIITSNHDPFNVDDILPGRDVFIGEKCWLGMNSVILPGVELGPGTVVGAGSVVTKSFPNGNCVIAGAPAKVIRYLI